MVRLEYLSGPQGWNLRSTTNRYSRIYFASGTCSSLARYRNKSRTCSSV